MKCMILCAASVMFAGGTAIAQYGPYTVLYDELGGIEIVRIDPGYQTMTSIAALAYPVDAIEYSVDGYIYGVSADQDTLIRVDPASGSVEDVGSLGIDVGEWVDLDEDDLGQLWMLEGFDAGRLFTIDRTTGIATLECQTDFPYLSGLTMVDGRWVTGMLDWPDPPQDPGCGLEFLSPLPVWKLHLEATNGGWIYELNPTCVTQFCWYRFNRTNSTNGTREFLGEFVYRWGGLSGITFNPDFQPQPSPSIPDLGWPGAAVLVLLMTVTGAFIVWRRG